jgi:hypothetical protein
MAYGWKCFSGEMRERRAWVGPSALRVASRRYRQSAILPRGVGAPPGWLVRYRTKAVRTAAYGPSSITLGIPTITPLSSSLEVIPFTS